MNKKIFYEVFGWYGMLAIISAYFANSFGFLDSHAVTYQLLNISGALGIVLVSFTKKAYQPMLLNAIWVVIGIIALIGILFS